MWKGRASKCRIGKDKCFEVFVLGFQEHSTMNSCFILLCLCVSSASYSYASSAADTPQHEENAFLHWLRILKDKIVEIWNAVKHKVVGMWSDVEKEVMDHCSCITLVCGCCVHLGKNESELNSTICVNVTFLERDYGISFTFTVNKNTFFNETISARNPPICLPVPYVEKFVDACIRLYDIDVTTRLHACVGLEARILILSHKEFEIACFSIGPHGLSNVTKPETSLESRVESHRMAVITVAVTTGLSFLAVVIFVVIAFVRRRGLAQGRGRDLLLKRWQNYRSLGSTSDDGRIML